LNWGCFTIGFFLALRGNRSSNQLVGYSLPSATGFNSYQANLPALIENTGWEFELFAKNIFTSNFNWNISLNVSFPRNKLISFPNLASSSYANQYVVGQPLSIVQKLHFAGVNRNTGEPMFEDVNKDGTISPYTSSYNSQKGDLVIAGKTAPDWYAGFSNSLTFRGFQLDIFLQYVNQQGYNTLANYTSFGLLFNAWNNYLGYWKKDGDITNLPKPTAKFSLLNNNFSNSTATFGDASFLRVKNISLSYSLPQKWTRPIKVSECKIYVQAQNPITITKFKGYDPETAGNYYLTISSLKIYSGGLVLSF